MISIDQFNYADLDQVLQGGEGEPFLLILYGIEDPRNLGELIRTTDVRQSLPASLIGETLWGNRHISHA